MASVRSTGAAMLSTVSTTANVFTAVVNGIGNAVEYGSNYLNSALADQRLQLALHDKKRFSIAERRLKQDLAELEIETKRFLNQSADHAFFYEKVESEAEKIMAEVRAELEKNNA